MNHLDELKETLQKEVQGNNVLHELAFSRKVLDNKIREMDKEVKELKKQRKELEASIIDLMNASMIDKVSVKGVGTISVQTKAYVNIKKATEEDAFELLKKMDAGYLIKPTVNANTFKSWWNEENERRRKNGEKELKDIFGDTVSVYEEQKLSVRKSR